MVLVNRYFKGVGSTQTSIFSPNTVFHSLYYIQESLHHVCFLQFSFISVQPLHCYISLWNFQIALVTDFPRVIIITSVLILRSKVAYWPCWYKRYVTKAFCIYRKLFCNCCQRTVILQTWTYRNGMWIIMDVREGNFNGKLYFHKEKDWLDAVVTAENLSYLLLIQVLQINCFWLVKLREARSERKIARPIHHETRSTIQRKGKIRQFARCFIHLFIVTVFKFSYWSLQDIYEFVTTFREWIWTSVELKIQIRRCDVTSFRSNWWKWFSVVFLTIMLTKALQTFKSLFLKMACTFHFKVYAFITLDNWQSAV